ncbi:MAG: hypothetical protein HAW67_03055 [Endozoicomonadaceae bacterium]|nr:hypothetical protein [Endozoicomonadaceae bacterium]
MFTNNVNTQEITKFQSIKNQYTSMTLPDEIAVKQLATLSTQSAKIAYLLKLMHTLYTSEEQYRNEKGNIQKIANTLNIPLQLLNDIECWVFVHNNKVKSIKNIQH